MQELGMVLALLVGLGGGALLVALVPPLALLWTAAGLSLLGLLTGLPGGIVYHMVLRRELRTMGPLPRDWLWHPTRYHARLTEPARLRMRRWFVLGGAGFLLVMLGAGLATLTLVTHFS